MRTGRGNPPTEQSPAKYMIHGNERRLLKIKRNHEKWVVRLLLKNGCTEEHPSITKSKDAINEIEKYLAILFDNGDEIMKNEILLKYKVKIEQ